MYYTTTMHYYHRQEDYSCRLILLVVAAAKSLLRSARTLFGALPAGQVMPRTTCANTTQRSCTPASIAPSRLDETLSAVVPAITNGALSATGQRVARTGTTAEPWILQATSTSASGLALIKVAQEPTGLSTMSFGKRLMALSRRATSFTTSTGSRATTASRTWLRSLAQTITSDMRSLTKPVFDNWKRNCGRSANPFPSRNLVALSGSASFGSPSVPHKCREACGRNPERTRK